MSSSEDDEDFSPGEEEEEKVFNSYFDLNWTVILLKREAGHFECLYLVKVNMNKLGALG